MSDPPAEHGNGLSLSGWGATLRATGRDVILLVVITAGFTAVATLMRDELKLTASENAARHAEHAAIINAQGNLACALLMSLDERQRFNADPSKICDYLSVVRGR